MLSLFSRDPDRRPDNLARALDRALRVLLDSIAGHALAEDAESTEKLRTRIHAISGALSEKPGAAAALITAGAVSNALEEYRDNTARYFRTRSAEFQRIIAQLTSAVCAIAPVEHGAAKLQAIQGQLGAATAIEDLQAIRVRVAECLEAVRDEAARHREQSARQVAELRETVSKMRSRAAAPVRPRTDPITGLAERADAEAAMLEGIADERPLYVAVFVITRASAVNARYGRQTGDEMLGFCAGHLARSLSRMDRLFRWTGPAFVALLEREQPAPSVQDEIAAFANQRLSKTIVVDGRSIMLPLTTAWTVFPALEIRPLQELVRRIEAFAMASAGGAIAAASA